jgi:prefoldin alpha subunit
LLYQTTAKAVEFYDGKVKGLETNLQELEKIVQTKSTQLRVVEESEFISGEIGDVLSIALRPLVAYANIYPVALRQKMLAGEGAPTQAAAAG